MALDEAIATSVRKGDSPPTLRLYGWDKPSLSLGHFQKASDINTEYCGANGIPVVRRPTGGRAILHDKELTYSFSAKTDEGPFSGSLLDSYGKISRAFALAFLKAGIQAYTRAKRERGKVLAGSPLCFRSSSFGEILIDNRKVVGSAQKRWRDGLLQQGSIPYRYNEERLRGVFGVEKIAELRKYMIALEEVLPGLEEDGFKEKIREAFEETFGISFLSSPPSLRESLLALELQEGKYLQREWNHLRRVPPVFR